MYCTVTYSVWNNSNEWHYAKIRGTDLQYLRLLYMFCYVSACKLYPFPKLFEQSHDPRLLLHHQHNNCKFNVNFTNVLKFIYFTPLMSPFCHSLHTSDVLTAVCMFCAITFQAVWRIFGKNVKMQDKRNIDWLKYISLLVCHKDEGQ